MLRTLRLSMLLTLLGGCADDATRPDQTVQQTDLSPRPRPDLVATLRQDAATPRHPSDGGGRAWLDVEESTAPPIRAGQSVRLLVVYEAGPLGVAEDGLVFLQASSFWGWSPPHDLDPAMPGYTEVTTTAPGVTVETETFGSHLLAARIGGRALESGEQLRFVYGAGEQGARVDRYAERASRLWVAVDGDGDGVRALVSDSPSIDISASEPVGLVATLPSVCRPGDRVRLTLAAVDVLGNAGYPLTATIHLQSSPPGLAIPDSAEIEADDAGSLSLEIRAPTTGVYRIVAETEDGLQGQSNPLFVTPKLPRLLWADLHGHSTALRRYADAGGLLPLRPRRRRPRRRRAHRSRPLGDAAARRAPRSVGADPARHSERAPARPVRHAPRLRVDQLAARPSPRALLLRRGRGLSSLDAALSSIRASSGAPAGLPRSTFAHHSAGEPVPTNWTIPPDPCSSR